MNYYEHHLGDFLKDAGHLSMLEEGAYRRLLDRYYISEGPLPADKRIVYKLARASTAPERRAVDYVLGQFFCETSEGYRQTRADAEIQKYSERAARSRENGKGGGRPRKTQQVNSGIPSGNPPATQTEPSQSPIPNPQSPDVLESPSQDTHAPTPVSRAPDPPPGSVPPHVPTPASAVCVLLRSMGMLDGHPDHPQLRALLAAGATIGEFECAARDAVGKGKGFAYAMAVVRGQREAAARIAIHPAVQDTRRWEPPAEDAEYAQG